MRELDEDFEKIVLTRLMYINKIIAGIITGFILGMGVFLATIFLVIKGGSVVGPHLELLGQYFYGYKVTYAGSLVGLIYGFILGFAIGYAISSLYNWLASLRSKKQES